MKKTYTAPHLGVYDLGAPAQPICTSMETDGTAETNEVLSTGTSRNPWSSSAWETATDDDEEY